MELHGNILKMKTIFGNPVEYRLPIGTQELAMSSLIGSYIRLEWNNSINCVKCGRPTLKSFSQGYCYNCFKSAPETAPCILNPELCDAHLGIARDMNWAKDNCLKEHFVYLAISSNLKVGVTRASQIPTRWIDQGAWAAIKLASAPNRYTAGVIEVELKKYFSDKTNWQQMLKNNRPEIDLITEKQRASQLLPLPLQQYLTSDDTIIEIEYPVLYFPQKVKSIDLEKNPIIEAKLTGIKGQYLMFDTDQVINVRKYSGYFMKVSF